METINSATRSSNTEIFGNLYNETQHRPFTYLVDTDKMRAFLSYIYEWKGLTQSSQLPPTKKEYQKKARNWLNGRRPKKYGNTLCVDMLTHCQKVCISYFCHSDL